MKKNLLLFVCLLFALLTGYKGFGQSVIYTLYRANVTGVVNDCGNGNVYDGCGADQIGFTWTDNALPCGAVPTGMTVIFTQGVYCGNAIALPYYMNGTFDGDIAPVNNCTCNMYAIAAYTVPCPTGNYVVGGTNTFLITPDNCFGYYYFNNNISGVYAQVVVSYTVGSTGCNLGTESNPGGTTAAQCSPQWETAANCGPGATVGIAAADVLANTYYDFQVGTAGTLASSTGIYVAGDCQTTSNYYGSYVSGTPGVTIGTDRICGQWSTASSSVLQYRYSAPSATITSGTGAAAVATVCSGATTSYTLTTANVSSAGVAPYTWSVGATTGGASASIGSAGTASPNVTFTSSGTVGTVKLTCTVTNNNKCSAAASTFTITVNPAVTATNTGGSSPICSGTSPGTFTATASGGGGGYTYQWYNTGGAIGGATASTYAAPTLTANNGYYCIVTATCGSVTTNTISITVYPAVGATISGGNTPICYNTSPGTFVATASGGTGSYTYQWYNGSGAIGGATASSYSPGNLTSSNSFYCAVTSTGGCGTANTSITNITVDASLVAVITGGTTTICSGASPGTFTVTASGGNGSYTYQWYNGSGIIGGSTASTYTAPTLVANNQYYASVTSGGGCGSVSSSAVSITVQSPGVSVGSAVGPVCQGGNTGALNGSYSGSSTSAIWSDGGAGGSFTNNGGTTPGTATYTASATAPASVTLTLATTGGSCGTTSASKTLTVNPNATIGLTSAAGTDAQSLCANVAITNITYAVGGGGTGAGITGLPTGINANFSGGVLTISGTPGPLTSGTYNYTVTTTGTCTQATAAGSITVSQIATISLTSAAGTNGQTLCASTAITNITYAVGGGGTGAGATGLPTGVTGSFSAGVFTISGTPAAGTSGVYNYIVTTTGTCSQTTATGSITVNPVATIVRTSTTGTDAQTVCQNVAIANITYAVGGGGTGAGVTGLPTGVTGSFNGGVFTISGTPSVSGTFSYTITTTGTCTQATAAGSITVSPIAVISLTSAVGSDAQTLCANTAITNITYSVTGGGTGAGVSGLPTGVTGNFSGGVFTISGTPGPLTSGVYNYTVTTTGTCSQTTANGSITVNPIATIGLTSATGTNAQSLCINTAITNITYAVGGGGTGAGITGLPTGVTGNFSGGVFTISGTPSVSGTFSYTVTTTGTCTQTTANGSITVNPNATISLTSAVGTDAQTLCQNTAITNITYAVGGGGTGAGVTGLPTGVTGNFSGGVFTISGTPSVSGTFSYTVTTTGSCVQTSAGGSITVNPVATISRTSGAGTDAQTLCANTVITNITYAVGGGGTGAGVSGLPTGVTGNFSGGVFTISGTPGPSTSGVYTYTITTTGTCTQATASGTITVNPIATISLTSAAGTDGQTLCAATAITNITYAVGGGGTSAGVTGLPSGVTGNFSGGVFTISGTPVAGTSGVYNYTVTTSGTCTQTTATGSITVNPVATISRTSGVGTDAQALCQNTAITNITYAVGGGGTGAGVSGLPTGVTGSFSGGVFTISGTPSVSGTFNYTVTTTGTCAQATAVGVITVNPIATISLTSAAGTDGQTLCATTAITDITYAVGGGGTSAGVTGLPSGVAGNFSGGVFTISGTPAAGSSGVYNYIVTTSGTCTQTTATGSITVNPVATINRTSNVGTDAQTLCATTAINNITYAVGGGGTGAGVTGLPTGVTGNFSGGVFTISGAPSAGTSGVYIYTVTTTGTCAQATANGTITVNPIATIALTSAVGTDTQTVCSTTPITNITYAVGGGGTSAGVTGLPPGVTGNFSGGVFTISGTPAALDSGLYSYTVTTSGTCTQTTAGGTINVNPVPVITVSPSAVAICSATAPDIILTSSVTGTSYAWSVVETGSVTGGASGTSTPIAQTLTNSSNSTAGTATYTIIGSASGCSSTASAVVTVNPIPVITATPPSSTICNLTTTSIALSSTASGSVYTWSVAEASGITGATACNSACGSNIGQTLSNSNATSATATYTITGAANGCSASVAEIVTVNPSPEGSITGTTSICNGTSTALTFNFTVGTSPFSVTYTDGTNIFTRTGVLNGDTIVVAPALGTTTYTFTSITDASTCNRSSGFSGGASVTVTPLPAINSVVKTNVLCFGGNTATITVTASSGTTPYSYSIDNGSTYQSGNFFGGLIIGSYNIVVKDIQGCSIAYASNPVLVTQPALLTQVDTATSASCSNVFDGKIAITAAGGTAPYQYSLNGGPSQPGSLFTGLSAGTYVVEVIDASGCTDTVNTIINNSYIVADSIVSQTNVSCYGGSNGAVTVQLTGGTPAYVYSINGTIFTSSPVFTGLTAGNYVVTLRDSRGCTDFLSVQITQPNQLAVTIDSTHNVLCNGTGTGAIYITATGGTTPYSYLWTGGATTGNISNLSFGTYTVTVTDSNSCATFVTGTISQPQALFVSTSSFSNLKCFHDSSGAVNISVSGGVAPYSYTWNNGSTSQNISGVDTGNYIVMVADNNGCAKNDTQRITQPPILATTLTPVNVSCFGGSNGSVGLAVSGGTTNYTYFWSNGATTPGISGVGVGTYTVAVTDAHSCSVANSATVTQPAAIAIVDTVVNAGCNGNSGGINIGVTGGTTPYTYAWTGGATTQDITGAAGNYTVVVTDAHSCTASVSVTITQPAALTLAADSVTNVSCHGAANGSITTTITGGTTPYIYNWTGSTGTTGTITGLSSNTYTLTVTDANTCSITATFTVAEPTALTANITDTNVTCHGAANGSSTVTPSGGTSPYTYLWSTFASGQTVTGLNGGNYFVIVTDAHGCTERDSVTISEPAAIAIVDTVINIGCNGNSGAINIGVTGGTTPYTYAWTGGATTQDITGAAGNYTVVVTDAHSCTASVSVTITQPAALTLAADSVTNVSCHGAANGSITTTITGGTTPYIYNWTGSSSTTGTATGLSGNTYTLTVTDANTCSITATFTVAEPTALTANITDTNVTCHGAANGSSAVTPSGGTSPYTYLWSTFSGNQTVTGLSGGGYFVIITDAHNCTERDSVTITEPAAIAIVDTVINIGCNGNSGAINIGVTGGTTPYTYAWTGGATTQDITGAAGSYTVIVTDAHSCTASVSATITQPAPLTLAADSVTNVSCNGAANGSISTTITGGTTPYACVWTGSAGTTGTITGLSGNTYTLTVTDANTCSITTTFTVAEPTALTANITDTNVTCHGAANGSSTVTPAGGTSPYTYLWSTFASGQTVTGLTGGNYFVIVTDAHGCTERDSVTISEPAAIAIVDTVINIGCNGNSGAINIGVTGGTTPYTYAWTGGATTQDITGAAGSYTVIVTDAHSCTASVSATITQPAPLTLAADSVTNVSCNGAANGSISTTITGGTTPYTYVWTGSSSTTGTATGLSGNTYNLTVTDANTCSITATFTVAEPTALTANITDTNVTCHGAANGSSTVTPSGGTSPYTYLWSTFSANQTVTGLSGGNYFVIVTDAHGCTERDSVNITEPAAIAIVDTVINIGCNGNSGAINIGVTGGTTPYTYAWTGGITTQDITGAAGAYTVIVTDAHSCTASVSATITQPAPLTIAADSVTNVSCNGAANGSISTTITGGTTPYIYSWTGSSSTTGTATGLSGNTYTLTVTDANTCSITATFTVAEPTALTANITDTNVTCHGAANGSSTVTPSGGTSPYTYLWSTFASGQTVTGLNGGNYFVIVTDAHGCTERDSVTISEPAAIAIVDTVINIGCNGNSGGINIGVTGGTTPYTYAWTGGATTQDITGAAGNYTVIVTDAHSCTASVSVTITQPAALTLAADSVTNVSCNGAANGSISTTITGGTTPYTYVWTGSSSTTGTATGLSGNTYTLTVSDANTCSITATFTVAEPTALTANITDTNVTCHGAANGSSTVTPSGGTSPYTYLWSTFASGQTVTGLNGGNYFVIVTDAHGCTERDSVTISEPAAIAIVDTVLNAGCNGNSGGINIGVTGGTTPYTYAWTGGATTQDITGAAGNYTVIVTDAHSCTASVSVTITQPATLILAADSVTNVSCHGSANGSISTTITGGTMPYTYNWTNSTGTTGTITGLSGNTYTLTVTDANTCSITATFTVAEPTALTANITDTNVTCHGAANGSSTVTPSGGTSPYTYLWSTFSANQTVTGLSGGNYFVIVTDAHGCTERDSVNITEPAAIAIVDTVINIGCNGNSGAINIGVTGGTTPYTYAWTGGATTQDITGAAGNYTVVVTDAHSCTASVSVTITQPAALTLAADSVTNVSCNGAANGSISTTITGGTTPYTYNWTNSTGTTGTITGLSGNTYNLTVTDANTCSITATFTVAEPTALTANITDTNVTCHGAANGSSTVTPTGGTAPYTYLWSTFASGQTVTGLNGGNYFVIVTDAHGCTERDSVTITEPAAIAIVDTLLNAGCNGNSGGINIGVTGGTTPYTYAWTGGATTQDITGAAGNYTVIVTDAHSCTASVSVTITQPAPLTLAADSVTNVSCNGAANGSISTTITGGTTPYAYSWTGSSSTTGTATGLSGNTYNLTVTDANTCSITATFTVAEPTALTANITDTNVTCHGAANGSSTVTPTGGTAPYTYLWSTFASGQTVTGLNGGNYFVIVTDAHGCTERDSVTITEPAAIAIVDTLLNAGCNGNSGGINIGVTGGTTPYTYAWTGGATTQDITGAAGNYTVVVTDAHSCTASVSVTITQPAPLTLAADSVTNVSCNGAANGSISTTITGGTTPYAYSWTGSSSTTGTATGLSGNTYNLTVTDANTCSITATFTVAEPTALTANITDTNVTCHGAANGSSTVTPAGGTAPYTYLWSTFASGQTVTGLTGGNYFVIVTDAHGCTERDSVTITEPAAIAIVDTVLNAGCNGNSGGINIGVTGGTTPYTYAWTGGATTQDITGAAGTYTVIVTDAHSCTASVSVTITQPAALTLAADSVTNVSCHGSANGSISTTITGGTMPYTYNWTNSTGTTGTITGLSGNTYTLTVTDANTCSITTTFTVAEPTALTANITDTNVTCHGAANGSSTVTPSGGTSPYTYLWSTFASGQTVTGLNGGNYFVIVTDAHGCTERDSVTISEPAAIAIVDTVLNVGCNGNSGGINIGVTGGTTPYTYAWTGGATTQDITGAAGNYTVIVTDAHSCTASVSVTITQPAALTLAADSVTNVSCHGSANGSISTTITGGTTPYIYNWTGSSSTTGTATGLSGNTYTLTVTDANTCSITATFTVAEPTALTANITDTNVTCHGAANGSSTVTPAGGTAPYAYLWSTFSANQTVTGLNGGNYFVIVTDAHGCTERDSVTISEPAAIAIVDTVLNAGCNGNSGGINIGVTGGTTPYTYAWTGGATTQDITGAAGTYTVIVTDAHSCTASVSVTITQPAALTLAADSVTNVSCNGAANGSISTTITGGTTPYTYVWTGSSSTTGTATGLSGNTYTLTVTDANTCSITATFTVAEPTALTANITDTNVTCHGAANGSSTVTPAGGTAPYTYLWSTFASGQTVTGLNGGNYFVIVTDAHGCTERDSVTISEPAAIAIVDTVLNAGCNGNSGGINIGVTGGTTPYTYAWTGGATTQDITGAAGTYTVIVTDAHSCTASVSATITQPAPLAIAADSVTNVSCHGSANGSISTTITGGTTPYIYNWTGSSSTTGTATGLSGNTYTLTVTDANTCSITATFTVAEPTALTANITDTNVTCHGAANGSSTVTPAGGTAPYAYLWSTFSANQTVTGLNGGNYFVIVTDAHGCTERDSVTISEPAAIAIVDTVLNVGCNGNSGAINIGVTGGTTPYTYAWTGGATTQDITGAAGTYTVIVTDAHSCTASVSATITQPAPLAIAADSVTNVSCNGAANGSISTTITGGTTPYTYVWTGSTGTTGTITGLSGNTYTLTVTDANTCSITASFIVTEPAALTSSTTHVDVSCHGAADGSATVTANGGTGPYTYLWNNFQGADTATGLSGGTYFVIITDAHGCTKRDTAIVSEPAAIAIVDTVLNAGCNGNNGSINIGVTGGTTPYTYAWTGGITTQDIIGAAGNYTVIVTDAHSCTASVSATITQPAALTLTDSITDVTCNGLANGSISLAVSGGVTPYTYAWSNGGSSYYINLLTAANYSATVTDANSCSITASFTVGQPAVLTSSVTGINVSCNGTATGSASTSVTGGTSPYAYLWSNFRITPNVSNLIAGTYFVIITDANGCGNDDSVVITQPAAISISFHVTNVTCFGSSNGSVSSSITGGTPGYTFLWSNGATTQNITSLTAGTYILSVTDNNGCMGVDSIAVTQPNVLAASGVVTNVHCAGGTDGSIVLSVSGGTAPYLYIWSNGDTTSTVSNLSSGGYTVSITDLNSCSISLSFNIGNPSPIVSSVVSVGITCNGIGSGSATLTVNGGNPPYTFFWSNFQVTQNINGLAGGTYYVIITDSTGCTHRDSAIITQPTPIYLTTSVVNITCFNSNNGAINLTVTGGNPGYTYLWSNGFTTQNISGLGGGTYGVTVTDANACTASASVILTNPTSLLTNFVVHNDSCFGQNNGSIDLIQSGGTPNYSFVWNTNPPDTTQDISGLSAGVYTVTVTDYSGCINVDSAIITQPGALYTSGVVKNVTCFGDSDGAVNITAYGGSLPYNFSWSSGPSTEDIYQLTGGNYIVTVTDVNGCHVASLYVVHEPLQLTGTLTSTNVTCYGGSNGTAIESAGGGSKPYQYLWNDFITDSTRSGLTAGRYVVLLTDSNGCHLYDSVNITQPTQIVLNASVTNATCYNATTGAVSTVVSGGTPGYTYAWTGGSTSSDITGIGNGVYTLTVTDAASCSVTDSFTVMQPVQIFVSMPTEKPSCFGGANGAVSAVAEQGIPPYTFAWNTTPAQTTITASGLVAGNYTVTVTDANGCTSSAVQTLDQPDSIEVGTNVTAARCFNTASGEVIANVTGGAGPYVYQLNGFLQASDTFRGLLPGNYAIVVTDLNGCDGEGSFTVNAPAQLSVSLSTTDQIILTGMKTQLIATAAPDTAITNYFWSPLTLDSASVFDFSGCGDSSDCSSPYITPPFTNVFTVTVENADSCFASDTITIYVNPDKVVFIPTAFTPNGDGLNDRFTFDILGASSVEVTVFDRWGERIYYNPSQTNGVGGGGWDGTKDGKQLPEDTYVYQLRITYFNGKVESRAGTITLMR